MSDRLLRHMAGPAYRPQKDHHLAEQMGLSVRDRSAFRALLRDLAERGEITKIRGNRWTLASKRAAVEGYIMVSPRGHGFVRLDPPSDGLTELFIPPDSIGGAMHGDRVACEIVRDRKSEGRSRGRQAAHKNDFKQEGRVVSIVSRRKTTMVGLLMKSSAYWYVVPDSPRIVHNVYVEPPSRELRSQLSKGRHKVVVRLDADNHDAEKLTGVIVEDLGDPDTPGVDVVSVLRDHEIPEVFSKASEKEAREKSRDFSDEEIAGRIDLRNELIVTIDPSDAKDHDDAVSLTEDENGNRVLGVHIADVSHFVKPNSPIDRDARARGNSVYMVDRFIPMLPPYLTKEVCSLRDNADRLAYSVFITYDNNAEVTGVSMGSSIVNPRVLLDYEHVQGIIMENAESDLPSEILDGLHKMNELALVLRKKRLANGGLDLSMPEVSCRLDDDGTPLEIHRRTSAEAYHLIEEFMLAANVAVASRILESEHSAIFRIHDEPSDDQWTQMAADLQQLGINETPHDRFDVQRILDKFKDQPLSYPASIAMLRNFMRAIYSAECSPHFGLAFERYTHFTSPIRRYADLVVHRILKSLDARSKPSYSRKECEAIADHCSQRERETAEAEEESLIVKRIQYYEELMRKRETGPWPALITGGTSRGLLVEIVDTLQRGFVPMHTLPDPAARHDRNTGFITGRKGLKLGRIGDIIEVQLVRVDTAKRMIELQWVPKEGGKKTTPAAKRRGKGKSGKKNYRK